MESTGVDVAACSGMIEELANRLFGTMDGAVAKAWVASVTQLAGYARAPVETMALDGEMEAMALARRVVGPLWEARLQGRIDELDALSWGDCPCVRCGAVTESQGRRPRTWKSLLGPLRLTRRYSTCGPCASGQWPSQEAIGLGIGPFTPRLEEAITMLATTVPHGMAVKLAEELLQTNVSEKGVQQMVEWRARGVTSCLDEDADRLTPYDKSGLPVAVQALPADAATTVEQVAYLEMDGVVPMTREELVGSELSDADRRKQRRAKKAGARGGRGRRYRLVGREVKNAVLYAGSDCLQESASRGCIVERHYVSHLGDWRGFALLVWIELLRQNYNNAQLLVVLSDGAEWIRSVCEWLPTSVVLILDLYHVKHRIWEVAHALYGEHTPAARRWAEVQCARIEAGEADRTIHSLRFLKPSRAEVQELVTSLADYLGNNRDRMDYPQYRAMGLRVGSGAVESANYHVTGARLKLQGMRWSEQGAKEMAYLRADLFNGRWADRTRQLLAA